MDAENLARMANRIGEFFAANPDRAEAMEGVATHIARYWEPRMRRQILQQLDEPATYRMTPLVAEALRIHRTHLTPVG
jgi:formate dehydrogenase subunit delta